MTSLHDLVQAAARLVRPAYLPRLIPIPGKLPAHRSGSRIGGTPFHPQGMRWPVHPDGDPYVFILQLRLEALPMAVGPHDGGLLQMFARHSKRFFGGGALDWADVTRWRLVPTARLEEEEADAPGTASCLKPRRIRRWHLTADWPGWEEQGEIEEQTGPIDENLWDAYLDVRQPNLYDKLGGRPDWQQDADVPSCPDCGRPMTFFLQLGAWEDDAVLWTGDTTLYAFVCARCPLRFHALCQK